MQHGKVIIGLHKVQTVGLLQYAEIYIIVHGQMTEWWGAGVGICLERSTDLHVAQLMPLPLTVSCFSKIQIGFTFLVPAHPVSPGQSAVKRVCVYTDR